MRDHIGIPLLLILAGSFMKILSVIIGHDNFLYFGINYIFHTADIVWLFLLGTFCVYEIKGHKYIRTLLLELELLRICISELLQDWDSSGFRILQQLNAKKNFTIEFARYAIL